MELFGLLVIRNLVGIFVILRWCWRSRWCQQWSQSVKQHTVSRSALGSTQPPIQWVPRLLAAGGWSWPLASISC